MLFFSLQQVKEQDDNDWLPGSIGQSIQWPHQTIWINILNKNKLFLKKKKEEMAADSTTDPYKEFELYLEKAHVSSPFLKKKINFSRWRAKYCRVDCVNHYLLKSYSFFGLISRRPIMAFLCHHLFFLGRKTVMCFHSICCFWKKREILKRKY